MPVRKKEKNVRAKYIKRGKIGDRGIKSMCGTDVVSRGQMDVGF